MLFPTTIDTIVVPFDMLQELFSSLNCVFFRFSVNLQHRSDVVLHVNPRYKWFWTVCGYVVHNSCQNGTWGWEENKSETPFPRGQTFTLQILVTQKSYKVFTLLQICFLSIKSFNFVLAINDRKTPFHHPSFFYYSKRITVILAFYR